MPGASAGAAVSIAGAFAGLPSVRTLAGRFLVVCGLQIEQEQRPLAMPCAKVLYAAAYCASVNFVSHGCVVSYQARWCATLAKCEIVPFWYFPHSKMGDWTQTLHCIFPALWGLTVQQIKSLNLLTLIQQHQAPLLIGPLPPAIPGIQHLTSFKKEKLLFSLTPSP